MSVDRYFKTDEQASYRSTSSIVPVIIYGILSVIFIAIAIVYISLTQRMNPPGIMFFSFPLAMLFIALTIHYFIRFMCNRKKIKNEPNNSVTATQNTMVQVHGAPVFIVTQCVSPAWGSNFIEFDENNKLWRLPAYPNFIFKYSELLDYEIMQNGTMVTKGGLGRAIVGGVLFGGVGAIVGGTTGKKKEREEITEYKIKIITSVLTCPLMYINLVATPVYSDSYTFSACTQIADKITAILSRIINENKAASATPQHPAPSVADEIMKYKQLLDAGAITQEEFETKKKQLLNL